MNKLKKTTHFGFTNVPWEEKEKKVNHVFESVAKNYDLMNNVLSLGIHHLWKRFTIELSNAQPGQIILDLAGGSGDLTSLLSKKTNHKAKIILADLNEAMLSQGRDRLLDEGLYKNIFFVQANAQNLPFNDNCFDCITIGFGLRNVTDQMAALISMYKVCKPGGKVMILEFSKPNNLLIDTIYNWYSFYIIPKMGQWFAKDAASYKYLVESIRMHPTAEQLKSTIEQAGFEECKFYRLTGGIVTLHIAYKF